VPSDEGLVRLGDALGEPVTLVGPLHGGVATSTHALETPSRSLVMKRFRADDDTAPLEWERLHVASASTMRTPKPVAFDLDGKWFGLATVVMTRLPGEVVYPPDVELLAGALAAIHATPLPQPIPAVLERPGLWATWQPEIPYPDGLLDAIEELRRTAPSLPTVFSHCDYHPGNVLIDGEAVSVIDWSAARLAAPGFDVGLMRGDLTIIPGGDAPDRFAAAYQRITGTTIPELALWDALAAARILEHGAGWIDAWTNCGIEITVEEILDRGHALALDAVRRARRLR
jgi:aminoglycoside phosphotransferase (APT) family kinase protein